MAIKYIQESLQAKEHSASYKMHKYFARRPHNVFHNLISNYTNKGEVVLDPFCGGGVTLVECLNLERKVIAADINPLATFVTECEATFVPQNEIDSEMNSIIEKFTVLSDKYFHTNCRICGKKASVRWYDAAYSVECPNCKKRTLLSNNNKTKNGFYKCTACNNEFSSVDQIKLGYELINVIYKCSCSKDRIKFPVNEYDITLKNDFDIHFDSLIKEYNLWYPDDKIPEFWDRQQEDCLYRKSIHQFSDLFTKRLLFFNAYLLHLIQARKNLVNTNIYKLLIFWFSAIIRYTNSMSYSADNWMGGRPIAWDKHAYWIPNQFVEVNPVEYIEKRKTAIISGLKAQSAALRNSKITNSHKQLEQSNNTHIIWNTSSKHLDIPDKSIDAVITDPPYGSNVQYGELSHFWLVWLQKYLNLNGKLFNLTGEILVNRKKSTKNYKDDNRYFQDLSDVYKECNRVLKPGGVLVFTFNNKDLKIWYSMIKSVINSGFNLEPTGILFQDYVENYKKTAHNRFKGSLHGDFIYTFVKNKEIVQELNSETEPALIDELRHIIKLCLENDNRKSTTVEFTNIVPRIIPILVNLSKVNFEISSMPRDLVTLWNHI